MGRRAPKRSVSGTRQPVSAIVATDPVPAEVLQPTRPVSSERAQSSPSPPPIFRVIQGEPQASSCPQDSPSESQRPAVFLGSHVVREVSVESEPQPGPSRAAEAISGKSPKRPSKQCCQGAENSAAKHRKGRKKIGGAGKVRGRTFA
jgi:hypothetical protein